MKNSGFSFFIIQTARLIVAMVVLFAICKPIAAGFEITGVDNIAPNCEEKIKPLCRHTQHGFLEKITVKLRDCRATCTYRSNAKPNTELVGGLWVFKGEHEEVILPPGMPCAFKATCDKNGKCLCDSCN
uniref:Putative salp15 n=1 Tax=Ixodes ricinus TaxID=34613 RepID=A0A0K8RB35_IXORI